MIVLALAEVNFSLWEENPPRGVDEPECSSKPIAGLLASKACGMVFGEQGGDSGWKVSLYDTGLLNRASSSENVTVLA
jgi:hypothetical protein